LQVLDPPNTVNLAVYLVNSSPDGLLISRNGIAAFLPPQTPLFARQTALSTFRLPNATFGPPNINEAEITHPKMFGCGFFFSLSFAP
jgi:hypothetical protein